MPIHRIHRGKPRHRSPVLLLISTVVAIALLYLYYSLFSTNGILISNPRRMRDLIVVHSRNPPRNAPDKYLFWGTRIDCPGKHRDTCAGLGHQESSLRCALEEALFLQRTFVMPSRMCINPMHNQKGNFDLSGNSRSVGGWTGSSCAMDSLYDLDRISDTVSVILENSKMWHRALSKSMKLGSRGVAHVQGISRTELRDNSSYSNILLINRTASPLSWFMECKDRKNRSAVLLPYSFLPSMGTKKLQDAVEKIRALLGDYDAIHVRRGDKIRTRKDRFGVERSLNPHLDRDTQPEFILCRIAKWVPPGRTLYIASNEKTPGFFSPLAVRYKLAYSSNFSSILDPVIENNYQLFMVERLIVMRAKTFIKTFKEDPTDLSLTDDPKKNTKIWGKPIYMMDGNKDC
ncbi:PREDICTED: uncharacterized protein LOC109158676 [Ipomoea nil]|uniref:uncharacterized protein LOC109158676 n=1 Tax=Ipomoea nil TaxID=35883 RepID=UPI000900D62E|nr:PREDICTED: uncharacterized protein LOC109158676 [Ipomoea nil]XP_019162115.1 PREDICTED: uncharacterized protein LOC109158676 [Ipomoea nil]